jgi:VanZ family protein
VTQASEPDRPAFPAGLPEDRQSSRPSALGRAWLWGPVALQMAIIFAASSIPDLGPLPGGITDSSGHSIGYALLGALLLRALARGRLSGVTWRRALAAVLLATLYGVSDEAHQAFVPGRSPDRFDVLADCVAVTLALVAAHARRWGILKSFR